MIPRLEQAYCLDDEVYYSDHVSATLTIDGETVYVVKCHEDYLALKRREIVTYRITAFHHLTDVDLYRCEMHGTDGSELAIHLSAEDTYHNIAIAERKVMDNVSEMVC